LEQAERILRVERRRCGRCTRTARFVSSGTEFVEGCQVGAVYGTSWHGIFENDGFRRAFLTMVAEHAGRRFTVAPDVSFADVRERRLDALGDLVAEHLDTDALLALIDKGAPAGLPIVRATLEA